MSYARGTATPINPDVRHARVNPARVAAGRPIPSDRKVMRLIVPVARKPARNKARVK
jgi:hypothetical protein